MRWRGGKWLAGDMTGGDLQRRRMEEGGKRWRQKERRARRKQRGKEAGKEANEGKKEGGEERKNGE